MEFENGSLQEFNERTYRYDYHASLLGGISLGLLETILTPKFFCSFCGKDHATSHFYKEMFFKTF